MKNKILAFAFLATVGLSTATPAIANDDKSKVKTELRFLGNINNQPVFELTLDNTSEAEFTVIIRDEYSNVLYRHNSKTSSFSKKFLLNTDELGDDGLRFEIITGKNQKPVVYEVNRNSRVLQEVTVNKIQ